MWQPRKFTPRHLRICTLKWSGWSNIEIAQTVRCSEQLVSMVLASDEGQAILEELGRRTLDTVLDVQAEAQAFAPDALHELVGLMYNGKDERVRKTACTDILALAGHQPVKRIAIERPDPVVDKYRDQTEDQIRKQLIQELALSEGNETVH